MMAGGNAITGVPMTLMANVAQLPSMLTGGGATPFANNPLLAAAAANMTAIGASTCTAVAAPRSKMEIAEEMAEKNAQAADRTATKVSEEAAQLAEMVKARAHSWTKNGDAAIGINQIVHMQLAACSQL